MTITVPDGYVYLDWAATAPLCEEAVAAMQPYLLPGTANLSLGMNANSLHSPGRAAFEAMELARKQVASELGASRPSEVVFTSGATEADNAALFGIAHAAQELYRKRRGKSFCGRVVTSGIEHEAVLISPEALEQLVDDNTVLVSVQMANAEVGAVQPIPELVRVAHDAGALFHTDATQALGKMPVDVGALGVDAASFSAHKISGPKGIGLLYLKARTPFEAQMLGGGQEEGRRSTTQNACGIAGFAAALHVACQELQAESERQRALRDWLYVRLSEIPRVRATVDVPQGSQEYLPNIVHVLVDGFESETLVLRLDAKGFGVSGGSACASRSLEPSHVLKALGVSPDDAYGALRISFGSLTTRDELERFASALEECVS